MPVDRDAASPARILATVLQRRWRVIGWALTAGFLVGVIVLVLPRTYTSTASVLPAARRSGGNLAGIAATLGFNLSGVDLNQTPAFYSDLAGSPTILMAVVNKPFHSPDSTSPARTLKDYYHIKAGPEALRSELAVKALSADLHPTLKARTGVVQLDATLKEPKLAHDVVQAVLDELGRYNIESRQSQAASERRFTEQRTAESKDSLLAAEDRLRRFLRANRGDLRASPDLQFEQDRLQREVTLRQQIYTTLAQAYEQARIEEVRDTPVLTVVEPPRIPAKADSRAVALKVLIAMCVGGMIALISVLVGATMTPPPAGDREAAARDLEAAWRATRHDVRHPVRGLQTALAGLRGRREA